MAIRVETENVRAVRGGTGNAKTAGNYAAGMRAQAEAARAGCVQVLWLDGVDRRYIEEVGAMNMFFTYGDTVVTAPLEGSILNGITRNSVIALAAELGFRVDERRIDIDTIMADIRDGKITEAF